jgi:hypothetical protein
MKNELEKIGKKAVLAYLRHYPSIYLGGLTRTIVVVKPTEIPNGYLPYAKQILSKWVLKKQGVRVL